MILWTCGLRVGVNKLLWKAGVRVAYPYTHVVNDPFGGADSSMTAGIL